MIVEGEVYECISIFGGVLLAIRIFRVHFVFTQIISQPLHVTIKMGVYESHMLSNTPMYCVKFDFLQEVSTLLYRFPATI